MGGSGWNRNPGKDRNSASLSPSELTGARRVPNILIAEDSKSDVFIIREVLKKTGIEANIHVTDDGEKTVRFFEQADFDPAAPCPDLILLDINMPRYKGSEILKHLRSSARCAGALVLVVTSSDSPRDREEMDRLGANGYFRKPSEVAEFMKLGSLIRELLGLRQDPPASAV
jgi:CheY-like chemotaxis protein